MSGSGSVLKFAVVCPRDCSSSGFTAAPASVCVRTYMAGGSSLGSTLLLVGSSCTSSLQPFIRLCARLHDHAAASSNEHGLYKIIGSKWHPSPVSFRRGKWPLFLLPFFLLRS